MPVETNVSNKLVEWSNDAGLQVTQGSDTEDGRTIIWSNLGETRYFISRHSDGLFIVTDSDRMGPEQFVFGAAEMEIIERFFFGKFGVSNRNQHHLPRLAYPSKVADIATGYSVTNVRLDGVKLLGLLNPAGVTIAVTRSDPTVGTADLAKISQFAQVSVDAIRESFLSPDGKPLFHLRTP